MLCIACCSANMAGVGSPSAPSIGVQAEFGVPPAATAPVMSREAGGGVFEDDDGSGEESGDDNARVRRGKVRGSVCLFVCL